MPCDSPMQLQARSRAAMCNSKIKTCHSTDIDGRRVLQPASCNRLDKVVCPVLKKPPSLPPSKRYSDINTSLNSSTEKTAVVATMRSPRVLRKKPKNLIDNSPDISPGSLAAKQREQAALMQEKRKLRIAHYGRKAESKVVSTCEPPPPVAGLEEKRCSFITPNSDPVYVAYHDEEWGVPIHDDKLLFELLVLSGAQVGLDWTTILKKRDDFRAAFAEFDAEAVSKLTEKQVVFLSEEYRIDLARVRGIVDNSKRILEIRKDFGTLDKYLWGFVNNKPLSPQYRSCRKIPAKTSKSESISKDMVRRGFRFVGPTVVHSFMQASGLTNDHLITCPRHAKCSMISS